VDLDVYSSEITDDRRRGWRRRLGSTTGGTDRTKNDQQCETGPDPDAHATHHISGIIGGGYGHAHRGSYMGGVVVPFAGFLLINCFVPSSLAHVPSRFGQERFTAVLRAEPVLRVAVHGEADSFANRHFAHRISHHRFLSLKRSYFPVRRAASPATSRSSLARASLASALARVAR